MPKYYCDYCDTYLTHDSPSVRKTHNTGKKHKDNVIAYYRQWMDQEIQKRVDSTVQAFSYTRKSGPMMPMMPVVPGLPGMGNPLPIPPIPGMGGIGSFPVGMPFPPMGVPPMGVPPPFPMPPLSGAMPLTGSFPMPPPNMAHSSQIANTVPGFLSNDSNV